MAFLAPEVAETDLSVSLSRYLVRIHQGKVRDTYALPDHPDKLLVVATDRVSIFDFVLGALIYHKGEVLTALTVFWLTRVLTGVRHHMLAYGSQIDRYLPMQLQGNRELMRRALVVEKHLMLELECIARGYLTGSGWTAYQETTAKDGVGKVCGIELPAGLHDGSPLEPAIFTPTTKAKVGHDEHVDREWARKQHGMWPEKLTLNLYSRAFAYAYERGIILADTKFEFSAQGVLADEVLTPDSSRFWDVDAYRTYQQRKVSPPGFDKEPLRQWGKKRAVLDGKPVDISKLDAKDPEQHKRVARIEVPREEIEQTTDRYLTTVDRLTGKELGRYQVEDMAA